MNRVNQTIKNLESKELLDIVGGKTISYGNGYYCNGSRCWVDWSETVRIIANNSAMNLATGGAAGWNPHAK